MPYTGDRKRQYDLEWRTKRRQEWIDSQGAKCSKCGAIDDLQVDHIDRSLKTMAPAAIWSRSEGIRQKELQNCQVLCHPCHKEKTREEMSVELEHGDYNLYCRGCRCDECKASVAPRWREYRKTHPRKK